MIFKIILIIIILIIIFLYLGIDLIGNIKKQSSEITFNFKILFLKKITIYSIEYPNNKEDIEKKEDEKKRDVDLKIIEPCIGPFLKFLKSLKNTMKVKKLHGHIDLGLTSYVSTAKYVGYIWAIFVMGNTTMNNTKFTAKPYFGDRIFDFKCIVDVNINLIKLIVPLITLLTNKNIRKLIKKVKK